MTKSIEEQIQEAEKQKSDVETLLIELRNKQKAEIEANNPTVQINGWDDIYKKLDCDPEKDIINIDKFTPGQTQFLKDIIKKVRMCQAYNGREKLTRDEERWYNWYIKNSAGAGLVFDGSYYCDGNASLSSGARLSLAKKEYLEDARKKFPDVDLNIIDL